MHQAKALDQLDYNFAGKKVLLRVDLNLPMSLGKVTEYQRIERILPTLKWLHERQAKIILLSHFGRPKGSFNPSLSLAPIVDAIKLFWPDKTPRSDFRFS